ALATHRANDLGASAVCRVDLDVLALGLHDLVDQRLVPLGSRLRGATRRTRRTSGDLATRLPVLVLPVATGDCLTQGRHSTRNTRRVRLAPRGVFVVADLKEA